MPGGKHEAFTDGPDEPSVHQASVKVIADRGMAVVTPLVRVDAGNAQRFWEALVSVSQDYAIIVVDLTALPVCDRHVFSALIMVLKYVDAAGGSCGWLRAARWSAGS